VLTARDPLMVEKAGRLAYFGLQQFSGFSQAQQSSTRWWDFQVSAFARRSIMNDMQSAVASVQLDRLAGFVARRREIAARYDDALADVPDLRTPPPLPPGHESSHYMYWVQMDERIRDDVARDLYAHGIYTTFRYAALHHVRAYGSAALLPDADRAVATTLCLPIHQALTDADVDRVVTVLRRAVAARSCALTPTVSA
jgi:aminotransferase